MNPAFAGGLVAALVAGGICLAGAGVVSSRRPSLESRVAPYVRDLGTTTGWATQRASDSAVSAFLALLSPLLQRGAAVLERVLGGKESVRRRLQRAGLHDQTVEQFRISQVLFGLGGFALAAAVGLLGPALHPGRALTWLLVCCGAGLLGVVARDNRLSSQVKRREDQMLAEFPVVADLLALAVAAGEGPVAALDRVVRSCRGALPDELSIVLASSYAGLPMTTALDQLAQRTGLPIVGRFAEGMAVALERGTPLAEVLNAQAGDVREASKRALIEAGARKEITMMIPVVFLLLPITLLFAFYPGVVGLHLLAP